MIKTKSNITEALGNQKIHQTTIDSEINLDQIIKILEENIVFFENQISKDDVYAHELYSFFKKNKKFNFPINKHVELYLKKNITNLKKIIDYIIFRYKFYIAGNKKINLGFPPYLLIELVSACNLRCPFCFQIDKTFTKKPYMGVIDFNFFKKVVDEANEIGVGAITMGSRGEPTLHKQLGEMLEYLSSKKNIFEVKLNSNATFLNENVCEKILKNNISQFIVSADHYEKEAYERLRKNSDFEKILKNVDTLYKIRKEKYPNSTTEIRVSGVDFEKKLDRKKFKDFWIKRSDHVSVTYPLERWDTYNNEPHDHISEACENLWDRMYVWYDGKVNPCDTDYKSYLSYGEVKNYSLKKIWNSKIIENTRRMHLSNERNKITPCDRCGVVFQ